ncbi:MAG: TIGR01777 family protein, partial [Alphaproteobacteria bacterium]
MTLAMLWLLTFQILFGALDNILHHEITERLPARPSARRELALHSGREASYGILFLLFAWIEPGGLAAMAVMGLLVMEVVITLADFLEEDRTRKLPPFERILHTVLAISYGAFLLLAVPWLVAQAAAPTGFVWVDHGLFSWFLTVASVGVLGFAIRNALAVRALGRMKPAARAAAPSGRSVLVTGGTGFV